MTQLEANLILHAPARLNIMVALAEVGENERISYPRLRDIVDLTPGNLTSHLRRLEDAGYVRTTKRIVKRAPLTEIQISRKGLRELDLYLDELRHFVNSISPLRGSD